MNGNCRFGTKCINEHLDVKQLLKSDIESAVNGNQWPISCFGPFKEKPSIPNFIEDQSFEEIRFLCYGARKQNFFENFAQQFNKEVLEAKNKMKMLLSLNKEVMDVVVNLYNANEPPKGSQNQQNPFAASNTQQNSGTNLFGTPSTMGTQSNIFDGASTGGNAFGGNNNAAAGGGSIFGGGQKPLLGQSAFGSFSANQQTTQQQPSAGLFSTPQSQVQKPNTFGGNLFAQAAQQNPVGGSSIFGGAQQQQAQPFGATNSTVFGQQANSGGIFGQANAQPQQPTLGGGNIFAQAAAQTQQQPSGFGLFSQPVQQQQQQQPPPPFGAQMNQQSPFAAAQPQQQQNSFFGQMQPQQQPQLQPNAGGLFNSQIPQQTQQFGQQLPQQQQQQSTGLFATAAAASTPFGQAQPQQQHANIFAQSAVSFQQPQQQQQFQTQATIASDRTYSKMENLTAEEIEAFKAETFELGKIPFSPPPRELVN